VPTLKPAPKRESDPAEQRLKVIGIRALLIVALLAASVALTLAILHFASASVAGQPERDTAALQGHSGAGWSCTARCAA